MIVIAVFGIIFCLRILSYAPFQIQLSSMSDENVAKEQHHIMMRIIQYVIGNLFSQGSLIKSHPPFYILGYTFGNLNFSYLSVTLGQRCYSQRLTFRIAAGVWALGCFFLVQIYCSTLTSHLTSPNQKPIVLFNHYSMLFYD